METTSTPASSVLVVDDEPQVVWVLQFSLEAEGYTTFAANNGIDAHGRDRRSTAPISWCSTS